MGLPVVLNTSFNANEPIVCTPDQALGMLGRAEKDALAITQWAQSAIGNYLVVKD